MGCHFLLQEIIPTQGLNPGLPHCRRAVYHLSQPLHCLYYGACPVAQWLKNLPAMQEPQETQVQCTGQEDPLEEGMTPTPGFLSGESHGERKLEGYSPWGHKDSDMTEQITHFTVNSYTVYRVNSIWHMLWCFPGGTSGKDPTGQCKRYNRYSFNPWVVKIPWRSSGQPIPEFLPGESHRQWSLVN